LAATILTGAQLFDFIILPISVLILLAILAIPVIFIYLFLKLTETAFEQVGFNHWHASLAVFGSILGSLINIPLNLHPIYTYPYWYISMASIFVSDFPYYFHPIYLVINFGGCIIPMMISCHLLITGRASAIKAAIGVLVVAIATYVAAEPMPYEGIVLPFWLSPILAAICGLALAWGYVGAPPLAYISGTIGTLLGADIFNLLTPGVLAELSPLGSFTTHPIYLSIGGAGVFDGIFLTGIMSVLLAAAIVCLFQGSCDGVKMFRS